MSDSIEVIHPSYHDPWETDHGPECDLDALYDKRSQMMEASENAREDERERRRAERDG